MNTTLENKTTTNASRTSFDRIMAYESGELDREEVIELFQALINTGLAWQLQGSYGRAASALIENGTCDPRMGN